jgi:HlyD family secretion protein
MRSKLTILAMTFLVLLTVAGSVACSKAGTSIPLSPSPSAQSNTNIPASAPASQLGRPGPSGAPGNRPPNPAPPAGTEPTTPAVTFTGHGTITIATYANLYFGTGGQIAQINIKQGDRVTRGTVLAKLDTTSLESALAQAQVNLDQAKLAQTQAESALTSAQFNLDKTQAVSDIKDEITKIEWNIQIAELRMQETQAISEQSAADYWTQQMNGYKLELAKQNQKLTDLLSNAEYTGSGALTYNIMGQTYDRLTVEDAHMKQLAVEAAQQTVDKSQAAINQAQKNIDLAQQQLNQATITAPFDGLVATLNGNGGDILAAPAQSQRPVIYLIDPTTLELNIQVNELDVPKVKLEQKAAVSIDAFPNLKMDGTVSEISTLPIVQGGIVDYAVTVTFSAPPNTDVRIGMDASATLTAG